MVSFSCERCGDIVKKPKADQHIAGCRSPMSCIDCGNTFSPQEVKSHTQCISEAQKYQGALYRPKQNNQNKPAATASTATIASPKVTPVVPAVAATEDIVEQAQEPTISKKKKRKKGILTVQPLSSSTSPAVLSTQKNKIADEEQEPAEETPRKKHKKKKAENGTEDLVVPTVDDTKKDKKANKKKISDSNDQNGNDVATESNGVKDDDISPTKYLCFVEQFPWDKTVKKMLRKAPMPVDQLQSSLIAAFMDQMKPQLESRFRQHLQETSFVEITEGTVQLRQ